MGAIEGDSCVDITHIDAARELFFKGLPVVIKKVNKIIVRDGVLRVDWGGINPGLVWRPCGAARESPDPAIPMQAVRYIPLELTLDSDFLSPPPSNPPVDDLEGKENARAPAEQYD